MKSWPHAPSKLVTEPGTYIITAATYRRLPLFAGPERLEILHSLLLETLAEKEWNPMAWAVFPNHYHVVGTSPDIPGTVREFTVKLHMRAAKALNEWDQTPGRQVWYRCWDTRITFEKSLLARLAYVHQNPVHHGLVQRAEDYPWCSMKWFVEQGELPFVQSVLSFKTDQVKVPDDF